MTDKYPDRPLITLAIFAFNQEKFIREAIKGALSQTYKPLEVIISDDCSTDSTYQVIQDTIAEYSGPHDVTTRRNELNLGTSLHIQAVAQAMKGELLVVAAGDDISLPSRVSCLVEAWDSFGRTSDIIHSYETTIDQNGNVLDHVVKPVSYNENIVTLAWFIKNRKIPMLSPTAAYSQSLFRDYPPLIGGSIIEDGPLLVRGLLRSSMLIVREPLVLQRVLCESCGTGYSCTDLPRWNRFIRSKIISGTNKIQDIELQKDSISRLKRILLARTLSEIRGFSRCIFPSRLAKNIWGRSLIIVMLCLYYRNNLSLPSRLAFSLRFTNLLKG